MNPRFRGFLTGSAAALLLSLCVLSGTAAGQSEGPGQSGDSVADAARRAREQKKNAKPVRTLTNDDLPAAPVPAGEAKPATASSDQMADQAGKEDQSKAGEKTEKGTAASNEAANEKRAEKKERVEAALRQAKADLAQSDGELQVLQRKQVLDSDSYYSKTDYRDDTAGKATLDQDAQDISDKKNQVEAIKSKIADLTAEFAELSNGEPADSQAEEQPQPQQQPPPQPPQ